MIHVFIVGSKGIPAQYGGFETFVENLTAGKQSDKIKYHVSCVNNDERHFEYNGADVKQSTCSEEKLDEWLGKNNLERNEYYLIVGRFVPSKFVKINIFVSNFFAKANKA
jgi:hypothetical protein